MLSLLAATLFLLPVQDPGTELTPETYDAVRDAVLPAPEDVAWLDVGWRTVLAEAVREARESDKPIFLWAMNGHPLGCT